VPSGPSRLFKRVAYTLFALAALGLAAGAAALYLSLPIRDGEFAVAGLGAPVSIEFDDYGIPRIAAETREDAFPALGHVTAGDRLFQMDLLRRATGGRLAEVFGPEALASDELHRRMGFEPVARAIFERLPPAQRAVLRAYSRGVDQTFSTVPPFEFLLLGYRPEPWRPEDSLLIVLGMYETLTYGGDQEAMATVMEATLPAPLMAS
jgi:penicillin amidase